MSKEEFKLTDVESEIWHMLERAGYFPYNSIYKTDLARYLRAHYLLSSKYQGIYVRTQGDFMPLPELGMLSIFAFEQLMEECSWKRYYNDSGGVIPFKELYPRVIATYERLKIKPKKLKKHVH